MYYDNETEPKNSKRAGGAIVAVDPNVSFTFRQPTLSAGQLHEEIRTSTASMVFGKLAQWWHTFVLRRRQADLTVETSGMRKAQIGEALQHHLRLWRPTAAGS
jgi:hypothetical protein